MVKNEGMVKVRVLNNKDKTYGVTIPKQHALFVKETWFSVQRSGTTLILTSGAKTIIDDNQLRSYKFEDCKI